MRHKSDSLTTQELERPLAAFLIPNNNQLLFEQASAFHNEHKELFIRPWAMIGQSRDRAGETETLILDTSKEKKDDPQTYVWQVTRTDNGHRDIWQVKVGDSSIEDYYYRLDRQGVLRRVFDAKALDCVSMVARSFYGGYVQEHVRKIYEAKQRAIDAFGDLVVANAHESRIKRQEKIMQSVGFGALQLYRPPSMVLTQGVVTDEGRRMFLESVERTQHLQATTVTE